MRAVTFPSARLLVILLAVLALAGGVRLLDAGYITDDWLLLDHVHRTSVGEDWRGPWLGERKAGFYRPLFIALYRVEAALFGFDPVAAHVHHLLWHMATALLLFAFLCGLGVSRTGAFLGALLFAWQPWNAFSVGWLASRTGTVAASLTLLACVCWLRWRRGAGKGWALGGVAAAVAAALTKESGFLAFPALTCIDLVALRLPLRSRRLIRPQAALVGIAVALVAFRALALGRLVGGYPVQEGMAGPGGAMRLLEAFGDGCWRLLMGVPPDVGFGAGATAGDGPTALALGAAVLSAAILVLGLAGARHARRASPAGIRAFGTLAALLGLQLVMLLVAQEPTLSRLHSQRWYGPALFFGGLLGAAAGSLRPRALLILPLALTAVWGLGLWKSEDLMLRASRISVGVLDRVAASAPELEDADAVFVTGLPENLGGVPLFWWGFDSAVRPPFREPGATWSAYPVHRLMNIAEPPFEGLEGPPVEVLLALAGRRPVRLPYPRTPDAKSALEAPIRYAEVPEAELQRALAQIFPGPPLRVLEPVEDVVTLRGAPRSLPLTVDTTGLARLDVFVYAPGRDSRTRLDVTGDRTTHDLWPQIDFVVHPERAAAEVFAVVVGWPREPGAPLRLGRVVTWRFRAP